MTPNITDSSSIVAWYRVNPERHAEMRDLMAFIDAWAAEQPQMQGDEVPA